MEPTERTQQDEGDEDEPRISRLSSFFPVAEALLAAAHSDKPPSSVEYATIHRLLCELLHVEKLPSRLQRRIDSFDPGSLDLRAIAGELERRPVISRRTLIELARQVCDADEDLDLNEDRFMVALSLALKLGEDEVGDVVVQSPFRGFKRVIKRVEDLLLGLVALFLLALPMMVIAVLVKLTSKGPVFFKQARHGRDGAEFRVFKFRSMTVQEDGANVVQAQRGDARITPLGGFLRRSSLDELPQILNVIRGEMSLVGPRPHAVAHNLAYRTKIREYMRRHHVKPGITGWAQVNGFRGETDTLDKMVARVEHDLAYIRSWSLWLDIKILFLTVFGRKVRQNAY